MQNWCTHICDSLMVSQNVAHLFAFKSLSKCAAILHIHVRLRQKAWCEPFAVPSRGLCDQFLKSSGSCAFGLQRFPLTFQLQTRHLLHFAPGIPRFHLSAKWHHQRRAASKKLIAENAQPKWPRPFFSVAPRPKPRSGAFFSVYARPRPRTRAGSGAAGWSVRLFGRPAAQRGAARCEGADFLHQMTFWSLCGSQARSCSAGGNEWILDSFIVINFGFQLVPRLLKRGFEMKCDIFAISVLL